MHGLPYVNLTFCMNNYYNYRNIFEVGTTFLSQISYADQLTIVPFRSKFIIFVAYFNIGIGIDFDICP